VVCINGIHTALSIPLLVIYLAFPLYLLANFLSNNYIIFPRIHFCHETSCVLINLIEGALRTKIEFFEKRLALLFTYLLNDRDVN
jgi:hypothetical protein